MSDERRRRMTRVSESETLILSYRQSPKLDGLGTPIIAEVVRLTQEHEFVLSVVLPRNLYIANIT